MMVGPRGGLREPLGGRASDSDCDNDGQSEKLFFEGKSTSEDKDGAFVVVAGSLDATNDVAAKPGLGIKGAGSLLVMRRGREELS
jgi:hypothetical protein